MHVINEARAEQESLGAFVCRAIVAFWASRRLAAVCYAARDGYLDRLDCVDGDVYGYMGPTRQISPPLHL